MGADPVRKIPPPFAGLARGRQKNNPPAACPLMVSRARAGRRVSGNFSGCHQSVATRLWGGRKGRNGRSPCIVVAVAMDGRGMNCSGMQRRKRKRPFTLLLGPRTTFVGPFDGSVTWCKFPPTRCVSPPSTHKEFGYTKSKFKQVLQLSMNQSDRSRSSRSSTRRASLNGNWSGGGGVGGE